LPEGSQRKAEGAGRSESLKGEWREVQLPRPGCRLGGRRPGQRSGLVVLERQTGVAAPSTTYSTVELRYRLVG